MLMKYLYWITPILAWLAQVFMVFSSFSQVRFEEFITSVQAPFWFSNHQIVSGLHVNVSWYSLLTLVYSLFGFNLFTGRFVNLFSSLIFLFLLAYLLRKFFSVWVAVLILVTIALSPTRLFINSLNMHMALVYNLLIIIILILIKINFSQKFTSLGLTGIVFFLMMVDWLTYQSAAAFLPSLFIFYWLKLKHQNSKLLYISMAQVAFIMPVILTFLWVDNKQILIWDPEKNSGLFRGGGVLSPSDEIFSHNWTYFLTDIFKSGVSGHYEVALGEFSLIFPIISLLFLIYAVWKTLKKVKSSRQIIFLILPVMAINAVIFSLANALVLPGVNRMTPFLVCIYFLWIVVLFFSSKISTAWVKMTIIVFSLLLIHHLMVYPMNLSHLSVASPFKVTDWFDEKNPQSSVDKYLEVILKEDLILNCRDQLNQGGQCFYDFIYPSIVGSCLWNHLNCYSLKGYDPNTRGFVILDINNVDQKL